MPASVHKLLVAMEKQLKEVIKIVKIRLYPFC